MNVHVQIRPLTCTSHKSLKLTNTIMYTYYSLYFQRYNFTCNFFECILVVRLIYKHNGWIVLRINTKQFLENKVFKKKNQILILTSNVCSSLKTDAEFIALTISKTPLKLFSSWNTNIISIVLFTTDTLSSKFSVSIIHFSSQHINWKKGKK